jgi:hypothetical protein
MAPRLKRDKTATLPSDARAWLAGDKSCGFYQFKPDDELADLWNAYGSDSMFWRRDMSLPITLEDLEERENAWLGTGKGSEYGGESFFVYKHYSDEEQQTLWNERGDKDSFRWTLGMYRPAAIETQTRQENKCHQ